MNRSDVAHGALLALVIGFTIVMGVTSFTAGGPPSTPTVHLVRVVPAVGGGLPTAYFVVSVHTYCLQPPNSIDNLGAKVVYSADEGGHDLAQNYSSALGILSGSGPYYVLGTVLALPLWTNASSGADLTLNVTAQVPTYIGPYFSSTTWWHDNVSHHGGGLGARVYTQYAFNAYGPLLGAAAFDATAFAGLYRGSLGTAFHVGRLKLSWVSYLASWLWLLLGLLYVAWVVV